jgi:hypothetical protein
MRNKRRTPGKAFDTFHCKNCNREVTRRTSYAILPGDHQWKFSGPFKAERICRPGMGCRTTQETQN